MHLRFTLVVDFSGWNSYFIFHSKQISSYSKLHVECICFSTFQARTVIPIGGHWMILFFNKFFFSIVQCPTSVSIQWSTNSLWNTITLRIVKSPQQKVSLYAKWFHWILNEFTGYSEQRLMKKQWIHWSNEQGLVNYTHIL
jgi:hypothetical protein